MLCVCYKKRGILKHIYAITTYFVIFALTVIPLLKGKIVPSQTNKNKISLLILMYHGFTLGNNTSEYVLNVYDLEKDIVFLKENGYTFVNTHDLTNYVYNNSSLPQKIVMLTFDDGYLNNYTAAYPIIKKHNIKVVISPIAYYSEYYTYSSFEENPLYTHLAYKHIKEMHSAGFADFQNHSYNMHTLTPRKGSSKMKKEENKEYIREFYYDLKAAENIIKEFTGEKPHAYTYPFGSYNSESLGILKCCDYKITMTCEEGMNYISKDKNSLYMLKRFNRTPQKSAAQILSQY